METMYERSGQKADIYQQILFLIGGGAVVRFHNVPTIKDNTVAQHSYGAACLCYLLTDRKPSVNLLMAALTHDQAEQLWGDIPSPAKRALGVYETITDLEAKTLEENHALFPLTDEELYTLKLADWMDCLLYCVQERRLGNRNLEVVYRRQSDYIAQFMAVNANPPDYHHEHHIKMLIAIDKLWEESLG